jgi:dCTP diphosphatase
MTLKDDCDTSVQALKDVMLAFAQEREWIQFHNPKNLAMAIGVEVGELMDHFRWVEADSSASVLNSEDVRDAVANELADVTLFILQFATICKIDLTSSIMRKMGSNARNYPVDKARGNARKYTDLHEDAGPAN